jgi:hypothetical protein
MSVSQKDLIFTKDVMVKESNKWVLQPIDLKSDDPYFTIESDFGEKRPRIIRG